MLYCFALHSIALCCIALYYTPLDCVVLLCIALHVVLHCSALYWRLGQGQTQNMLLACNHLLLLRLSLLFPEKWGGPDRWSALGHSPPPLRLRIRLRLTHDLYHLAVRVLNGGVVVIQEGVLGEAKRDGRLAHSSSTQHHQLEVSKQQRANN